MCPITNTEARYILPIIYIHNPAIMYLAMQNSREGPASFQVFLNFGKF